VETDPVETDPAETDPVETDPAETDPTETDPITDPEPSGGSVLIPVLIGAAVVAVAAVATIVFIKRKKQ
jgi:hypothetical protein